MNNIYIGNKIINLKHVEKITKDETLDNFSYRIIINFISGKYDILQWGPNEKEAFEKFWVDLQRNCKKADK